MGLDIRLPIGGMFSLLGLLLLGYGLLTRGSEIYARSLGINVNIWWGLVMLIFGLMMLWLGWHGKSHVKPSTQNNADGNSPQDKTMGGRH